MVILIIYFFDTLSCFFAIADNKLLFPSIRYIPQLQIHIHRLNNTPAEHSEVIKNKSILSKQCSYIFTYYYKVLLLITHSVN